MDDHEMNWVVDSLTDNIEECERFALPIEAMKDARELITDLRKEVEKLKAELTHEKYKVDQQRKVLDWVLPQLFRRIYPQYDLGHPHMYVLITAVKQPDGGIPKDMWDTIKPFLDAKP